MHRRRVKDAKHMHMTLAMFVQTYSGCIQIMFVCVFRKQGCAWGCRTCRPQAP
jgi:hypothetical protein